MAIRFTAEQDAFLREHTQTARTYYDLTEQFVARFPEHPTNFRNLQKRAQKLGLRKGTHNVRRELLRQKNPVGTVIWNGKKSARVKTENGYAAANKYFKEKYFPGRDGKLVWLDGNPKNCAKENAEIVDKSVYASLCWRGWFFTDRELTKTAILTARLLLFFPEYTHNENQYLKIRRSL